MNSTRCIAIAVFSLIALGSVTVSCVSREEGPVLFDQAEQLILNGRFDDAIPVVKRYLVAHPFDSGGHYYLGRCYLNSESPWLFISEGELRTALHMFSAEGKRCTIARFTPEYFELSVHLELAKVYLRQMEVMVSINAPVGARKELLEKLRAEADSARAIAPDSPDVKQLDQLIKDVAETVDSLKPPARSKPSLDDQTFMST